MSVTREQLLQMFLDSGIEKSVVDGLKPGTPLTKQGVDSVDYPGILLTIKEKLNIEIGDKDACELKTLEDFENCINKK
jgi:acyl carrier protein